MEGFHSNLLTKNIAVGADAEVHATSAYTAGGKRIDNALGSDAGDGKSSSTRNDVNTNNERDNERRSEKRDRHENDAREVSSKKEKRDDYNISNPQERRETDSNSSESNGKYPAASVSKEVKKEVKISSARERYVARKQQEQ